MRKIPTLFKRTEDRRGVVDEFAPELVEYLDANGEMPDLWIPTRKWDGTCVMKFDGWWARREVKPGRVPPSGFREVSHDLVTGKRVGWEPIENTGFAKLLDEALGGVWTWDDGTYELCGPKINGNPEGFDKHTLVWHGGDVLQDVPRDFAGLRDYLLGHDYEGIVWWFAGGDPIAKLKKRDFPPATTENQA